MNWEKYRSEKNKLINIFENISQDEAIRVLLYLSLSDNYSKIQAYQLLLTEVIQECRFLNDHKSVMDFKKCNELIEKIDEIMSKHSDFKFPDDIPPDHGNKRMWVNNEILSFISSCNVSGLPAAFYVFSKISNPFINSLFLKYDAFIKGLRFDSEKNLFNSILIDELSFDRVEFFSIEKEFIVRDNLFLMIPTPYFFVGVFEVLSRNEFKEELKKIWFDEIGTNLQKIDFIETDLNNIQIENIDDNKIFACFQTLEGYDKLFSAHEFLVAYWIFGATQVQKLVNAIVENIDKISTAFTSIFAIKEMFDKYDSYELGVKSKLIITFTHAWEFSDSFFSNFGNIITNIWEFKKIKVNPQNIRISKDDFWIENSNSIYKSIDEKNKKIIEFNSQKELQKYDYKPEDLLMTISQLIFGLCKQFPELHTPDFMTICLEINGDVSFKIENAKIFLEQKHSHLVQQFAVEKLFPFITNDEFRSVEHKYKNTHIAKEVNFDPFFNHHPELLNEIIIFTRGVPEEMKRKMKKLGTEFENMTSKGIFDYITKKMEDLIVEISSIEERIFYAHVEQMSLYSSTAFNILLQERAEYYKSEVFEGETMKQHYVEATGNLRGFMMSLNKVVLFRKTTTCNHKKSKNIQEFIEMIENFAILWLTRISFLTVYRFSTKTNQKIEMFDSNEFPFFDLKTNFKKMVIWSTEGFLFPSDNQTWIESLGGNIKEIIEDLEKKWSTNRTLFSINPDFTCSNKLALKKTLEWNDFPLPVPLIFGDYTLSKESSSVIFDNCVDILFYEMSNFMNLSSSVIDNSLFKKYVSIISKGFEDHIFELVKDTFSNLQIRQNVKMEFGSVLQEFDVILEKSNHVICIECISFLNARMMCDTLNRIERINNKDKQVDKQKKLLESLHGIDKKVTVLKVSSKKTELENAIYFKDLVDEIKKIFSSK